MTSTFKFNDDTEVIPNVDEWKDDEHNELVLCLIDSDDKTLYETGIPAPVNNSDKYPVRIAIRIKHADGCSKEVARVSLPVY